MGAHFGLREGKRSEFSGERVGEDVAGSGDVLLSQSALNCLTCFRCKESIS